MFFSQPTTDKTNMTYTIKITTQPLSDGELYAAVVAIMKITAAPVYAKARAIRDLIPLTGISQMEAHLRGHRDRTPIIKGPLDDEPGVDKEWRLIWRD
jgi:hypothetical protein